MSTPPETLTDPVSETRFGDEYTDPYRWLEGDAETTAVAEWTDRQNDYADAVIDDALRGAFTPAFEALAEIADYGAAVARGGRCFSLDREADADRPRLVVRDDPDGDPRTLVDPADVDGEASVDWFDPHPSGERVAYGVARGGDEQYDLRVVDAETGETLVDRGTVGRTGENMFAWAGEGFYYVATGAPESGAQMEKEFRYFDGESEEAFATHDDQHVWPGLDYHVPTDTLVVSFSAMSGGTRVAAWRGGDDFDVLFDGGDANVGVTLTEESVFLRTDADAPRGRVLAADAADFFDGNDEPETVIPEGDGVIRDVAATPAHLLVHEHREAASHLAAYDHAGTHAFDVDLPARSSLDGLAADPDSETAFALVQGFDRPASVVEIDVASGETQVRREPTLDFDVDLTVSRLTVESADGTDVPVFLVHRADLEPEDAPTVVYAYGGFRVNLTPDFSRFRLPFLAAGGVYAQVCARGGSEFGEAWHEAGMRGEKQRTFEDVEAAADHLVDAGITTHEKVGVMGGSNGGLTVGAVLTRDPSRWGAAVCAVPLLDMLRFHRFLLGESWTPEYGHPEREGEYEWLAAYSPYQHVRERAYPPVLFTTAVGDSRVHPSHARKMTARLQNEASGGPFCLRTETDTGHGLGKSIDMAVREQLDQWTFLAQFLGVEVRDIPEV